MFSFIHSFKFEPSFVLDVISFGTPFVYALLVILGVQGMSTRKPYTLKVFSVIHSGFLCVLSLVMFLGILYGAVLKVQERNSLFCLFCDSGTEQKGILPFWITIYWLSKFPELLDTAILVLRKKPVIFLHVFHHAIMTLMPYLWLKGNWTLVWFGCWMNCGIHVFMYFYFAAAAAVNYQPWWKKLLTSAQILQFMLVFSSIVAFVVTQSLGYDCKGETWIVWFSFGVNLIFLGFFIKFFVDSYSKPKRT